jgi:hypothetical protein
MSFVTFGSDSERVPSVASPGRFFGIHASPNNYGQVMNIPIDDPFQTTHFPSWDVQEPGQMPTSPGNTICEPRAAPVVLLATPS